MENFKVSAIYPFSGYVPKTDFCDNESTFLNKSAVTSPTDSSRDKLLAPKLRSKHSQSSEVKNHKGFWSEFIIDFLYFFSKSKTELAAIKQHDIDTTGELETAKDRIRKLSEIVDATKEPSNPEQEISFKAEIIRQKEEMINCLQDELIKVRLREAENEESIRNLGEKVSELEEVSSTVYLNRGWNINIRIDIFILTEGLNRSFLRF